MTLCAFDDSTRPAPYFARDLSHRKVVRYHPYTDAWDTAGGHGTHVVGSILGLDPTDPNMGIAPAAKLSFMDLGDASDSLYTPSDLNKNYYPVFYEVIKSRTIYYPVI